MTRAPIEDLSAYLNREPTDLQARFAEYLLSDEVGYDPNSAKNKTEAFNEGVRLATALRMRFQASPTNKAANAARKRANANGGRAAQTSAETEEVTPKKRGRPAKAVSAAVSAPVKARPAAKRQAPGSGQAPAPF